MTQEEKRNKINRLVFDMLSESYQHMVRKIDEVLDSGSVDVDGWDENNAPMILPKCIVTAILKRESEQYEGKGTSFEKQLKKMSDNIKHFI